MRLINFIKQCIKNPYRIIIFLNDYGFHWLFSDKFLIRIRYKYRIRKRLNLKNPHTFNEKLQWLKLNNHQAIYTTMVDKYQVKNYISSKLGEEYVIPTLGVYDNFDEIDFESLPNQFVIKCTHDSGGLIICRDKSKLDIRHARKKINKTLKKNYFWKSREWPYKNVERKIIIEKYIGELKDNLVVYKNFCFNGEVKIFQVIQDDKTKDETIDYFDINWNLLDLRQNFPSSTKHLPKPKCLEEMILLSEKLSDRIPFVRVDWYIANDKLLFSEFTFFSDGGMAVFNPPEWDKKLGDYIDLTLVKRNKNGKK